MSLPFLKIINLLNPDKGAGLTQRMAKGALSLFAFKGADTVLRTVRLVILARLLAPEDFGLLGIALVAMGIVEAFTDIGLHQALIQKKERTEDYLNVAWTMGLIRDAALFLILFFLAPSIGNFFHSPQSVIFIRIIASFLLLKGLTNIGIIYFQKDLEFGSKYIGLVFVPALFDFAVVIPAAYLMQSVWALIFGLIASNITSVVLSYLLHSYRPRFEFSISKARNLLHFGKWLWGSSVLYFFANEGDDFFVGKFFGVPALGLYQVAYRIGHLSSKEVTKMLSRVTFPAYAKLQDDATRLRAGFLRTLNLYSLFALPTSFGLIFLAGEITELFLGAKWLPIVPVLQILVLSGLARAFMSIGDSILLGKGLPRVGFVILLIRVGLMAVLIYPLSQTMGIAGVAGAIALANVGVLPIWFIYLRKLVSCSIKDVAIALAPAVLGTGALSFVLILLKALIGDSVFEFFALVIAAAAVYCVFIFLVHRLSGLKPLDDLVLIVRSFRDKHRV